MTKKIICFLIPIVILISLNYAAVITQKQIQDLQRGNNIEHLEYCMENLADDQWRAYDSQLTFSQNIASGKRRICKGDFCVAMQTDPIPDALGSSIPPDGREPPLIEFAYDQNLTLFKSYGKQETIWAVQKYGAWDQWKINWDSKTNSYERNLTVEEYTGLNTNDIAKLFNECDQYLTELVQKMMEQELFDSRDYCAGLIQFVTIMNICSFITFMLFLLFRKRKLKKFVSKK